VGGLALFSPFFCYYGAFVVEFPGVAVAEPDVYVSHIAFGRDQVK